MYKLGEAEASSSAADERQCDRHQSGEVAATVP